MTELEKIEYTRMFVQTLSLGVDPMTGEPVPDGELLHHTRVKGCLTYVCELLNRLKPFVEEEEHFFAFSDVPVGIAELRRRLIEFLPKEIALGMKIRDLWSWLAENGLIEFIQVEEKMRKEPTELGREIGITTIFREYRGKIYHSIGFSHAAQEFITDNIQSLVDYIAARCKTRVAPENRGKKWSEEDENILVQLFQAGNSIMEIAETLKRSRSSIKTRLLKLGYLE